MEDPMADTEWNDILRSKGIIPKLPKQKEEDWEEEDQTEKVNEEEFNLSDLDEDDEIMEKIRQKRLKEIEELRKKSKYGSILEISGEDWIKEINEAGEDIWVIVHLYKTGVQLCNVINYHFQTLARQFPTTKFIKAVSTTCIPNYPDKNLPTIFVYHNNDMKAQIIGPKQFSLDVSKDQLEWCFKCLGAIPSLMEENPVKETRDEINRTIRSSENVGSNTTNNKYKFFGE